MLLQGAFCNVSMLRLILLYLKYIKISVFRGFTVHVNLQLGVLDVTVYVSVDSCPAVRTRLSLSDRMLSFCCCYKWKEH